MPCVVMRTYKGYGSVTIQGPLGELVNLDTTIEGAGFVSVHGSSGYEMVRIGTTKDGGEVIVSDETNEPVVTIRADEYGNGQAIYVTGD